MLNIDFFGPLPTVEYLFVMINAYSRFPEVEIVHSTSAKAIILIEFWPLMVSQTLYEVTMDLHLRVMKFKTTCKKMELNTGKSHPFGHNPILRQLHEATDESYSFCQCGRTSVQLYQFLLNYRATPHTTTGFASAKLLYHPSTSLQLSHLT